MAQTISAQALADWNAAGDLVESAARHAKPDERIAINVAGQDNLFLALRLRELADIDGSGAYRRRRSEVAVTVDYEAYEPPHSAAMLLKDDVFARQVLDPTEKLMRICERHGAKLTIFAEMCQFWLLRQLDPELADRIDAQLADAFKRGHEVQAHLHPRWLDDAGATVDNRSRALMRGPHERLHSLTDTQLLSVFKRAKAHIEALAPEGFQVSFFRGGKYQVQPTERIFEAMAQAGYKADSSVWSGARLPRNEDEPGFDFRTAWHSFHPYLPCAYDLCEPALKKDDTAPILEFPIYASGGRSWTFDTPDAQPQVELYDAARGVGGPRVMIGHSKMFDASAQQALDATLARVAADPNVKFSTMSGILANWTIRAKAAEAWADDWMLEANRARVATLLPTVAPEWSKQFEGKKVYLPNAGTGEGELLDLLAAGAFVSAADSSAAHLRRLHRLQRVLAGTSTPFEVSPMPASDTDIVLLKPSEVWAPATASEAELPTHRLASGHPSTAAKLRNQVLPLIWKVLQIIPERFRDWLLTHWRNLRQRQSRQALPRPLDGRTLRVPTLDF